MILTTNNEQRGLVHIQREDGSGVALCGSGPFEWAWEGLPEDVTCRRCRSKGSNLQPESP